LAESETGGNQRYPLLAVFDSTGRELTRQARCETTFEAFSERDGVCAILGADIAWEGSDSGDAAIRVSGWDGDGRDHRFHRQGGRYVAGPPLPDGE
jgi:hypothetical protein